MDRSTYASESDLLGLRALMDESYATTASRC
jgi:hypothetical protein